MKGKNRGPSKAKIAEALEQTWLGLAIYHASKGSVGEPKAKEMLDALAEHIFKSSQAPAMMRIQAAVLHYNKVMLEENPHLADPVASVPPAALEE